MFRQQAQQLLVWTPLKRQNSGALLSLSAPASLSPIAAQPCLGPCASARAPISVVEALPALSSCFRLEAQQKPHRARRSSCSSMSYRRRLKNKKPPEGWELIEEVIEDFEQQMKEAVNEDHEGKRKAECTWKIHRIHWEKNRFIYDLMYVRKVMSRELYDWLVREKIADGALISKWRKPGYELLCSTLAINKSNHHFGTTAHCRVPLKLRAAAQRVTPNVQTGCISCASGDGKFGGPIWWNTPLDDEEQETAEQNRATWAQPGVEEGAGPSGPPAVAASRKRQYEEEEEDLDDDVKKRLAALRGQG